MDGLLDRLPPYAGLLASLLLGAAAVWLLLPRERPARSRRVAGAALGAAALVVAGLTLIGPTGAAVEDAVFYLFAGVAVAAGVLTVTHSNPVYAALWFALATLSVCGLFLLRSAPFLAAATVIVYAGAIVVTFLFVIMLAQQQGTAVYDRAAVRPLPATLAAFVLLGGLLFTLQNWRGPDAARFLSAPEVVAANPLSRPDPGLGQMRGLGRSLFGDYLFAVEIAGTLLLVAAVGAIAIAPRRSGGGL